MGDKDKKVNFSRLDQRILQGVDPYSYASTGKGRRRALKNIILNKPYHNPGNVETPVFDEAFAYALGRGKPEDLLYFEPSPYKPTIGKDTDAEYLRLKNLDRSPMLVESALKAIGENTSAVINDDIPVTDKNYPDYVFGRYTVSKGKDDTGDYISMYDKWDLSNKMANKLLDRKPEFYDRIYYENSPDGIKVLDNYKQGGTVNKKIQKMASGGLTERIGSWLSDNTEEFVGGASDFTGLLSNIPYIGGIFGQFSEELSGLEGDLAQPRLEKEAKVKALTEMQQNQGAASLRTPYRPTFPMGGMIPYNVPVELENDEVFRTSGQRRLQEVDGKYHSQGGEDYMLPTGTEVMGNPINPTTGNMYKKDAMKLKKKQDKILNSKAKPGTIAYETNERNLNKIDDQFNNLFASQESMKCGGKVGKKMPDGGGVRRDTMRYEQNPYINMFTTPTLDYFGQEPNMMYNMPMLQTAGGTRMFANTQLPVRSYNPNSANNPSMPGRASMGLPMTTVAPQTVPAQTSSSVASTAPIYSSVSANPFSIYRDPSIVSNPYNTSDAPITQAPVTSTAIPDPITDPQGFGQAIGRTPGQANVSQASSGVQNINMKQNTGGPFDYADAIGLGASLAPVAYNLIQGSKKADKLNPSDYYNPEYANAINLMNNRTFDISDILEQNKINTAIAYNNLRNSGASAGQIYTGQQSNLTQRLRADAAARTKKQNVENVYRSQEAQIRAGLGGQKAATNLKVRDMNDANEAARRAYLSQGFADFGMAGQNFALQMNQQSRDQMLASLYPDMFQSIYPYMSGAQNIVQKYS